MSRDEGWRYDLWLLAREIRRIHYNRQVLREDFEAYVRSPHDAIPSLADCQIMVGLKKLLRLAGDGHTTVVSKRGHPGAMEALRSATFIGLTAVVLGEFLSGFTLGRREARNRQELVEFLASPRVHVLPMGLETGERFAVIYRLLREAGRPVPTNDLWIAASAMEHGLRVLTADEHYRWIPMILAEFVGRNGE